MKIFFYSGPHAELEKFTGDNFAVHLSCTGLGQKFTGVIKPETHLLRALSKFTGVIHNKPR